VQLQSELPHALPPIFEEPLGVGAILESQNTIVSIADHYHFSCGPVLPPVLYPKIENIMQVNVPEQRRKHAAYTKGNFQFERTVVGWRERYTLLDLRRK
jgi:hypothetical protein